MGIPDPGITGEALDMLCDYSWPGNVRELENAVQKALIFNRGGPVSHEGIARVSGIAQNKSLQEVHPPEEAIRTWIRNFLDSGNTFDSAMEYFSAIVITEALNLSGGNRSHAAKMLGLSRPTIVAKIEKHRIRLETAAKSEE
jgi:DNA-binding NtrC family response regulator